VRHGWDRKAGRIETKYGAGRRSVPVAAALRDELLERKLRLGREHGLIFGRTREIPFTPDVPYRRAKRAWEAAGLEPIGLHECRHTFASLMIAAGVNAKALSTFMGHSPVTITLDRYGHLMPGSEEEAAGMLDAYLDHANTRARKAAVAA
jgi:integrase